jgi:hypothetical protein
VCTLATGTTFARDMRPTLGLRCSRSVVYLLSCEFGANGRVMWRETEGSAATQEGDKIAVVQKTLEAKRGHKNISYIALALAVGAKHPRLNDLGERASAAHASLGEGWAKHERPFLSFSTPAIFAARVLGARETAGAEKGPKKREKKEKNFRIWFEQRRKWGGLHSHAFNAAFLGIPALFFWAGCWCWQAGSKEGRPTTIRDVDVLPAVLSQAPSSN